MAHAGNDDKEFDDEASRDYSRRVLMQKWEKKKVFFCNGGGEISQIPSLLKNIQA